MYRTLDEITEASRRGVTFGEMVRMDSGGTPPPPPPPPPPSPPDVGGGRVANPGKPKKR